MVITQGDVWWADLGKPVGSAPGYRRAVLVVQSDVFNNSLLGTILCAPLTGGIRRANVPGNVLLKASEIGLKQDSVVIVAQLLALDRSLFLDWTGRVSSRSLAEVFAGIDIVLGR